MLRELKINNLALIASLHLVFSAEKQKADSASLIVFTGETGAGKSIILQALNLLSGCKAANSWIRTGADTASVEALFAIPPGRKNLLNLLREKGFEVKDSLILKRIISKEKRSRYFINDSMATAVLVQFLFENLISVASQHEHQILLNPRNHLDFIDSVGELWSKRESFTDLYSTWSDLQARREKLLQQERDREQKRDLLAFQLGEIRSSAIMAGEDEELSAEKKVLKSSDTLMELGRECHHLLSDAVLSNLGQVRKNIEQIGQLDQAASEIVARVTDTCYELDDLNHQLKQYLDSIPSDPMRLEEIEARIDELQKLKRKYGGPQMLLSEVIRYADQAEEELSELDSMDQRLKETEKKLAALEGKLLADADTLSAARKKTAAGLEKAISRELRTLSFTAPVFKTAFKTGEKNIAQLSASGWDQVEFMFSANQGEPVKPLVKIASGGELSRLLLGLKCILARRDQVDTVIFDEVDAGIGGQAAEDIAGKIKELAKHHQVLCITHLPQIASKADEHFRVDKTLRHKRTLTEITMLDEQTRILELARMLAGDSVTQETITFAKGLLAKVHD